MFTSSLHEGGRRDERKEEKRKYPGERTTGEGGEIQNLETQNSAKKRARKVIIIV